MITLLEEREGRVISVQEPGKQGVSTLPARIPDDGGDRCQLPMIQGPCRMAIEQFYYDAEKGECFVFYYGGCKVLQTSIQFKGCISNDFYFRVMQTGSTRPKSVAMLAGESLK